VDAPRRTRVDQSVDAIARQQLAAAEMLVARAFTAALGDGRGFCSQVVDQRLLILDSMMLIFPPPVRAR
jgi:hypothetical protein